MGAKEAGIKAEARPCGMESRATQSFQGKVLGAFYQQRWVSQQKVNTGRTYRTHKHVDHAATKNFNLTLKLGKQTRV